MKKLTSTEIRKLWLDFFKEKNHEIIESAKIVPFDDDSLLFINAGVTPLKKYFDGSVVPNNKRMTNVQKCIRTNDIENVGVTSRHQTFFEMLGNFSIGDYFKEEAIEYGYEILTSSKWFDINKDKLYISVYPTDDVSYNKWIELGIDESHLARLEGNYWEIGEGPSGPCTEIFYDRGEDYDINNLSLEKWKNDEEQDRYVEIWNIVFSQYNAQNGVDRKDYKELPNKNIDTGAGLERIAMISQNVRNNFETDLFVPIIKNIEQLTNIKYNDQVEFKVIADHIRTVTVALSDGAYFDNTGRGYVLRRLLRRSVRMGKKLGLEEPFLYKIVDSVVDNLKESYPSITTNSGEVKVLVLNEEKLFHKTLASGEKRLHELINNAKNNKISGEEVFKLYDTYGFPFELTLEYLNEHNIMTDKDEFDLFMEKQKELAKSARKQTFNMNLQNKDLMDFKTISEFTYNIEDINSNVIGLFNKEEKIDEITDEGFVIFDKTNFYAESGGQSFDTGLIQSDTVTARVLDVQTAPNGQNLHEVKILKGSLKLNDKATLIVDKEKRLNTMKNHSATHLLQYALKTLISPTISQAGSHIDETSFRFDINFGSRITDKQLVEIEDFINEIIKNDVETKIEYMSLDDAKKLGANALFTEKYGDIVRVVTIVNSIELCGGTHVDNVSDIKKVALYNIESKGSNLYRIEGCSDTNISLILPNVILPYNNELLKLLMKAKNIIKDAKDNGIVLDFNVEIDNEEPTSYKDIIFNKNELEYVRDEVKQLELKYEKLRSDKILENANDHLEDIEEIKGINVLIKKFVNFDNKILKNLSDVVFNMMDNNSFLLFININGDNVNFISKSNSIISSNDVVKKFSVNAKGNGGGSNKFAQGGGISRDSLENDILELKQSIKE